MRAQILTDQHDYIVMKCTLGDEMLHNYVMEESKMKFLLHKINYKKEGSHARSTGN